MVVAIVATGLIVAVAAWRLRPPPPATPVTRFALTLPESQQFAATGRQALALSPDGSKLVYVSNNRLYVHALSELEPHVVPGPESNLAISSPTFSPDGQSIAFAMSSDNTIKRVATSGGVPVTVCTATAPYGVSWHASGILIGQGAQGIIRCSPNGGAPERLATVDPGEQAHGPQLLSDGSALLFTIAKAANGVTRWDTARIVMQTLKSGKRETVVNGGSDGRYLTTGHLLYVVGGVVLAAAFNPERPGVIGTRVPVIEGVRRPLAGNTGAAQFDVSPTGTLAYVPGPAGPRSTDVGIAIADRSGAVTRISTAIGAYTHVRASRDGKYLAVGSDDEKEAIVWITDVDARSTIRRLTIGSQNRFPIWSPDGQKVAFQSNREGDFGIFAQRADGAGTVERLTKASNGERHVPESWSPDGKHLSFSVVKDGKYQLWMLSLDDLKAAPFANVESAEPIGSIFSPDGRWIAYAATPLDDTTILVNRGVYIQPFPAAGTERYQVPKQQMDFQPVWSAKGDELMYVPTAASGRLAIVSVSTTPSVTFGPLRTFPAVVTAGRLSGQPRAYDLMPDGRTVGLLSVAESNSSPAASQQVRVTLNWFEELKARVPTR
jgi:Tol biopolymer transport system component